jgi:pectate lyase
MAANRRVVSSRGWEVLRPSPSLLAAACALVCGSLGCSVRDSNLITALATDDAGEAGANGEQPPSVIAAIDERPIGGASLTMGTTGGGSYAEALANGAVSTVSTLDELATALGGDTPAVVLVAEGMLVGAGNPQTVQVCTQACPAGSPIAQQTVAGGLCTNGETLVTTELTNDTLRVGSNKTIIGLGAGARFSNVAVDLSGSSNIILRNVSIEDVGDGLSSVVDGLTIWPGDHIWIDHVTFRNISRAYVNLASSWDDSNGQALTVEAGYVTFTNVHFDGFVRGSCTQKSEFVLGSSRNPAITVAGSWFDGARDRNPYLFGPGTWGHAFNNLWTNIDKTGLGVSCGAIGIAQGNVFQSTHDALRVDDAGLPTWLFCAAGMFGQLYAPTTTGSDEDNLIDTASTLDLNSQPTSGVGLALPVRITDDDFELTVPVQLGASTATYRVTLAPDPNGVPALVEAEAGVGHLF